LKWLLAQLAAQLFAHAGRAAVVRFAERLRGWALYSPSPAELLRWLASARITCTACAGLNPLFATGIVGQGFFRRKAAGAESQLLLACSGTTSVGAPFSVI